MEEITKLPMIKELSTGTTFEVLPELLLEHRTSDWTMKQECPVLVYVSDLIAQRACCKTRQALQMRQSSVVLFPERTYLQKPFTSSRTGRVALNWSPSTVRPRPPRLVRN